MLSLDACPPKSTSTSFKMHPSFWPDSSGATLVIRNDTSSSQLYIVTPSKQFETAFVDVFRSSTQNILRNQWVASCPASRCEFGAMPAMIRAINLLCLQQILAQKYLNPSLFSNLTNLSAPMLLHRAAKREANKPLIYRRRADYHKKS